MSDEKGHWHRLDNTANLFPVITSRKYTNVFRVSVSLGEGVDAELLQKALVAVLPRFSAFRVRLRRGMFWYYFEENTAMPTVYHEADYPCRFIDPLQNDHFLFQVSYYENRINLEVFHVLTDGNAGKDFLLAILCQYLMLAHPASFSQEDKSRKWFTGHAADVEDSYLQNYAPTKKNSYRTGRAYKIRGERSLLGNISVFHLHLDVAQFRRFCKEKQVTMTQYLSAVIGWAVCNQRPRSLARLPVNIFLPVDLRKMFDSETALNFFSNVYIRFAGGASNQVFEEVLADVKQQFEEKINRESMLGHISYTTANRKNPFIRAIPLPVKSAVLRTVYELNARSNTLSFSNLGAIGLPPQFAPFVTGATLLMSCTPKEPFKCAAISYQNDFAFTMTSTLRSVSLQRAIARKLAADGLDVVVETNGVDYGSM